MSFLQCSQCGKPLSATHKKCPHCGKSVFLLAELKCQVEQSRLWQVGLMVLCLLLVGVGWFWRMDSGARWPLYVTLVLVAPLIPWLLQLAYKSASPLSMQQSAASDEDHVSQRPGAAPHEAAVRTQIAPLGRNDAPLADKTQPRPTQVKAQEDPREGESF